MRAIDWERRLTDAVKTGLRARFEWGTHDCVTFASRCVVAVLGDAQGAPLIAGWSGAYDSEAGAAELLARMGGLEASVRARLGEPLASTLKARRGDLVLLRAGFGSEDPALGICVGKHAAFAAPFGLAHVSIDECALAWRVG